MELSSNKKDISFTRDASALRAVAEYYKVDPTALKLRTQFFTLSAAATYLSHELDTGHLALHVL